MFNSKNTEKEYCTPRVKIGLVAVELAIQTIKNFITTNLEHKNKPGPAQDGAISKAQKKQKDFQVSSGKKLRTKKMDRVARRSPLARAPGALKSHNAEKLKRGPFEVFQHPFCRKT